MINFYFPWNHQKTYDFRGIINWLIRLMLEGIFGDNPLSKLCITEKIKKKNVISQTYEESFKYFPLETLNIIGKYFQVSSGIQFLWSLVLTGNFKGCTAPGPALLVARRGPVPKNKKLKIEKKNIFWF